MQFTYWLIVFVAAVFIVLWSLSIYLIRKDKLSAHDWSLRSLGLPQGSVRAMIAFMLIAMLIYIGINNIILVDLPDWLVGIMGTVIGFYFGTALVPKPSNKP